ncbi:NF-kappa-B inhibitor-interacting Ras-like protein 2 [Clonorchis sinensis]|uniref:NF-kappa-B inhibitor-interacting Ras-like protein 2 n=1 Tax=Clonorchis sinensis TaxID=79923 RepID=G7Y612_CLOSI|nr:NF-kappa-B inhibitor-interacting Ras-like protein 2 [Clonorchis sinensis]
MGKLCRLIVSGPSAVGKTSMIEQCIYGNYTSKGPSDFFPTYEDTYNAVVETDRGTKEKVRIYELGGKAKIERHFVNCADVFILVYDIGDLEECRGKREIFFVFCGNKADKPKDPSLDSASLSDWAQRERVHLFETSVLDRQALCNVLTWIVSRVTQSPGKSSFPFGKKESRPFVNVAGAKSEAE